MTIFTANFYVKFRLQNSEYCDRMLVQSTINVTKSQHRTPHREPGRIWADDSVKSDL